MNDQPPSPYPDARVTITDETVTIIEWDPRLLRTAMLARQKDGRLDVVYADLWLFGHPAVTEVMISHDIPDLLDAESRALLVRWASNVGLERIFFPDELVEVPRKFDGSLSAAVTCPICKSRIAAGGLQFALSLKEAGMFPTRCSQCGGNLPQWEVEVADKAEMAS